MRSASCEACSKSSRSPTMTRAAGTRAADGEPRRRHRGRDAGADAGQQPRQRQQEIGFGGDGDVGAVEGKMRIEHGIDEAAAVPLQPVGRRPARRSPSVSPPAYRPHRGRSPSGTGDRERRCALAGFRRRRASAHRRRSSAPSGQDPRPPRRDAPPREVGTCCGGTQPSSERDRSGTTTARRPKPSIRSRSSSTSPGVR